MAKRTFQIAFYGAAGAGKTKTLRGLHALLPKSGARRRVTQSGTKAVTLFFDYQLAADRGVTATLRMRGYTGSDDVASQAFMSLVRCSGLVFVFDAQRSRLADNAAAWRAALEHFRTYGVSVSKQLPIVIQLTKVDRPDAVSPSEARRQLKLDATVPCIETHPAKGRGLEELARAIEREVLEAFHDKRIDGRPSTTPSTKYLERAGALAAAADVTMKVGPKGMARLHLSTKEMVLGPSSASPRCRASRRSRPFVHVLERG